VRLLLDTHTFIWWREDNLRLRSKPRHEIANAETVFVSAASAWEIAIKVAQGKLEVPGPIAEAVADSGFEPLEINFRHAKAAGSLPLHHGDPFDRMLIAQAQVNHLTLVTHDKDFRKYGVPILWT